MATDPGPFVNTFPGPRPDEPAPDPNQTDLLPSPADDTAEGTPAIPLLPPDPSAPSTDQPKSEEQAAEDTGAGD